MALLQMIESSLLELLALFEALKMKNEHKHWTHTVSIFVPFFPLKQVSWKKHSPGDVIF